MGTPAEPPRPRKKRRWLRRIMLAGIVALALVLAFHRPLLRSALDWGGRKFAPMAGLTLQWGVGGTVTSDLDLSGIHATGDAMVQRLEVRRATAVYSLPDLASKGIGAFLKAMEIEDAEVALDFRSPAPATATTSKPSGTTSLPVLSLPRVSIHNLSADIVTATDDIVIRGLTLELDDRHPGEIRMDEFVMPSQQLHLLGVQGRTEVKGNTIVITDLSIMNRLTVTRLAIDLNKLHDGWATLESAVAIGDGVVAVKAETHDLGTTLNAEASIEGLSSDDLMTFGLASDDPAWRLDHVKLGVSGAPMEPKKLRADFSAGASGIRAGNVQVDRVTFAAGLDAGVCTVKSAKVEAGDNRLEISGSATLPDDWQKASLIAPTLDWRLHAPELQRFFRNAAPVKGSLEGSGVVALAEGKLNSAAGTIVGETLVVPGATIAHLNADFSTDASSVRVKTLHAQLDEKNAIDVSGSMTLDEPQATKVDWHVSLGDLASLAASDALKSLALEMKGQLTAEGSAELNLADVMKADIGGIKGTTTATLTDFEWQHRAVKGVELKAAMHDARIDFEKLTVASDEHNAAQVSGSLSLAQSLPLDLTWQLQCADVPALAKTAGVPDDFMPTAGAINGHGRVQGPLKEMLEQQLDHATAAAVIGVSGLRVKDACLESFHVEASLAEGRAELKRADLKLDADNSISVTGGLALRAPKTFEASLNGTLRQLSSLKGWTALAKGPVLEGGDLDLKWSGHGDIGRKQIDGGGSLKLEALRVGAMPDPLTAVIEAHHSGAQTEITSMEVSVGKFQALARASISPEAVRVPSLKLTAGETKLMEGSIDLPIDTSVGSPPIDRTKPLSIRLAMDKLDFAEMAKALGQASPVSGTATMNVDLHGLLPQLEGVINLDLDRVVAMKDKLEPASVKLESVLGGGRLKAHLVAEQKPLKPLDASAELPVDILRLLAEPQSFMEEPVTAHVALPDSDLDVVKRLVPAITDIRGRLAADVSVSGQIKAPKMQGQLSADVPLLLMRAPQAPEVKGLKARITFADERISIEEVSAMLAGGSAKVSGKVDLTSIKNPAFDLRITANDALLVRDESISQRANADLTIRGALNKADVSGRVDLTRGRVFKEIEFLPLTLPDQLPPPPPPAKRIADEGVKAPPPFDQWTVNVDVGTHDPIRLLGNVLNGGVLVDLHARGTGAAPTVEGKVTLDGARLRLPFSRLALNRGNILFSKEKFLNPELDIEGDALVDRYHVTLNATGSAYDPKVRFSSSPPLSEGDIATLLATGATSDDLRSAEGVAANKAAFLFVTQMYRKIFKKTGRQRYDEEPPKLSFSFSLLNSGSTQRSVSAVYEISPKIQAVGSVSERGGFRGLLYYLVRFP